MSMNELHDLKLTSGQRILILIPMLIGSFIALINETLLSVAFPQLSLSLNVPLGTVQWLATAYVLVIGISVPVVAFLMESFTTKKMFLLAMLLFVCSTVCCGFSGSFPVLLFFRIVQGIGTGMLVPLMTNTVLAIFPVEKRGTVLGLSLVAISVAPAVGPTAAGILLLYFSWNWLFFSMLPLAFIAIIIGAYSLRNVSGLTRPKIDILSIVLSTIGFGGLIFGITSIDLMGIDNITVQVSLLAGIAGLILFVRRQFILEHPLLELRAFRYPMFALGSGIMMISFMIPFATIIIVPTYMQSVLGVTPSIAGLALMPAGIANAILLPIAGWLYDRIGARIPAIAGFIVLVFTMFFLSQLSASTSLITVIVLHVLVLVGISFINPTVQINTLNQLPQKYNSHGVAITSSIMQIASAFGSSLFIGLMASQHEKYLLKIENPDTIQNRMALVSGIHVAFTAAFILVIIGLILSFFLKRKTTGEQFLMSGQDLAGLSNQEIS